MSQENSGQVIQVPNTLRLKVGGRFGAIDPGAIAKAEAALKSLSHRGDGTLSAQIAAPRSEDINPVLLALQARGYRITAQPMAGSDGQQLANVTIRAVP